MLLLSIIVRKIFPSQSVGKERLLRAATASSLYLSQFAFFKLEYVRGRTGLVVVFICNLMRNGRWSELSVYRVFQEHEVMREADDNETSVELGSVFGGTLVGVSLLRIPLSDPWIESPIILPLVSVDLEYQDGWCALKSQG